jgi:hypothetical protein
MVQLSNNAIVFIPRLYPPCDQNFPSTYIDRNCFNNRQQSRIHNETDDFVLDNESFDVPVRLCGSDRFELNFVAIDHDCLFRIPRYRLVDVPDLQLEQVNQAWFCDLGKEVHDFLLGHAGSIAVGAMLHGSQPWRHM